MLNRNVGSGRRKCLLTALIALGAVSFAMLSAQTIDAAHAAPQGERGESLQTPPLRLSEPVEDVIADLEQYIPERMAERNIPGVAIALIHDNEVVWEEGFGVASTVTGEPVTSETVFEVASLSKPVLAYTALRLVDRGLLSLDEPLVDYLPGPWLPPSKYSDIVTMRHTLSHTSGITSNLGTHSPSIPPGSAYFYSATGIRYTQAVIEEVTGQPLEEAAREEVFEPLGMTSSSFTGNRELAPRVANGHINLAIPLILFIVPSLLITLVVGLVGLIIQRIWIKRWRPTRQLIVGAAAMDLLLYFLAAYLLLGSDFPEHVLLIFLCVAGFSVIYGAIIYGGHRLMSWLFTARLGAKGHGILTVLWAVMAGGLLIWLAAGVTAVPVPKSPVVQANGAGTLRSTSGDLAAFLIELAHPQHLGPDVAAELPVSQVTLSKDLSWGLGYGIVHSREGDAYWQWGQTVDFQTVMIIYPEQGLGVVVLTNGGFFNTDTAIEIAQRAVGGPLDPILKGSHLAYNYSGED